MLRKINITNAGFLFLIQVNLFVFCHKPTEPIQLWMKPAPEIAKTAAVYGEIRNPFGKDVEIRNIVSNHYKTVEFHESSLDNETQIARMRKLEYPILLETNQTIQLMRSGKHLMLYEKGNVSGDLTLEFQFSNGESRTVIVEEKK
ncbi:copper chaperone PCu(A)C [Leptospira sp. 2 VSF19]|uniref:Copper chaperone PCu(A)C n=1 Tax=Leptospira soteropolitanensis TaxID=2950025 RepID=A0AAW5VHZ0_9LEPT|nr:copper chaperone PCu(A)C [Leptospira soteropolitanensis]MCW7501492.1 copper chaperone PCu(A)C [Leptospira soteropolitanensis]MCW7527609.1 copper chaperone PCu(A)C [Leptospira soteropolitanensis]MCW7531463.1 copper chaperone PCu(A)C [Leptospira soteropolitanensis]